MYNGFVEVQHQTSCFVVLNQQRCAAVNQHNEDV